jgi:integral membrane protein
MPNRMLTSPIGRFRIIAFLEGLSFLLILFVTMPLKYYFQSPTPNLVVGMFHGILFMVYIYAALRLKLSENWDTRLTLKTLAASLIPFGTFYMEYKVFRHLMH